MTNNLKEEEMETIGEVEEPNVWNYDDIMFEFNSEIISIYSGDDDEVDWENFLEEVDTDKLFTQEEVNDVTLEHRLPAGTFTPKEED